MSRTVHMHIGLAKSGTTYVQHLLQANRPLLAENGVLFPGPRMSEHFMAALDLSGARFRGHTYAEAEGAWARLAEQANGHPGSTVISHEMFAPASAEAIHRALESLDTPDVRVVVTARDLARQVPAVWQERVKNGNQERYSDYLDTIFRSPQGRRNQGAFWRQQHLSGIARRWANAVGAERLTLVTLPPSGADPEQLWNRFSSAVELPPLDYSFEVGVRNASLGPVETELLRRLNGHLPELPWPQYVRRVKRRLSEGTLAATSNSGRLVVPPDFRDDVVQEAERTITELRELGCRVIGDLDELRPATRTIDSVLPDEVGTEALLEVALAQLGQHISRPLPPKPSPSKGHRGRNLLGAVKARLPGR